MAASTFISLRHTTRYAYAAAVQLGPQVVRLCPTPYSRARISNYSLTVSPRDHLVTWSADPNGNWLARFVFPGRADEFRVDVALTAELRPMNPFDFVVDFGPGQQPDLFNRYFGLNEALAALFGRKVDLAMAGGMVNPYFIDSVNRTRKPVYARPLAEAA